MYERVFGQGFVSPGGMTTTKVLTPHFQTHIRTVVVPN